MGLTATGWFNAASCAAPGSTSGFEYASQGVGFGEVEVDCLTGEVQILRCDLHMDLGSSLNPLVDIGQVPPPPASAPVAAAAAAAAAATYLCAGVRTRAGLLAEPPSV